MQRVIPKCNNKIKIKNTSGTIRALFFKTKISYFSPVVRRGYLESSGLSADGRYLTYVAHFAPMRRLV